MRQHPFPERAGKRGGGSAKHLADLDGEVVEQLDEYSRFMEGSVLQDREAGGFDCAILDGNLKGRPVDEIAAALTRRNTPFLFVSGYGRAGLPQAFAKARVLTKPFTLSQLLDAVRELTPRQGTVIQLRK